jgi:DNA-binding transcriptional MocR family regulator
MAVAARFGVSESTINRALSQLRSEGLVRTQQGRGTRNRDGHAVPAAAVARLLGIPEGADAVHPDRHRRRKPLVEANMIVILTHQWTLRYIWPAE